MISGYLRNDGRKGIRNTIVVAYLVECAHHVAREIVHPFRDQGVHLIDLAGIFLGEFTQIEGHVATYFWNMPVDDNAFVSLRNAEGKTAWLHASCTEWKNMFSLEIYGRDGKLHMEGLGGSYGLERLYYYKMLPQMGPPETTLWEYPRGDESWKIEMQEFFEDIRLKRTPVPGLKEAKAVLQVVERIYARAVK